MTVFASPDFGAGGFVCFLVLIAFAFVVVLAVLGIVWGTDSIRKATAKSRRGWFLVIVVSALLPVCCCLGPPLEVRLSRGSFPLWRYPNNKIKNDMTADEVTAILGTPHELMKRDDGDQWFYWLDSFGIGWFCVRFGPEGRVIGTSGN